MSLFSGNSLSYANDNSCRAIVPLRNAVLRSQDYVGRWYEAQNAGTERVADQRLIQPFRSSFIFRSGHRFTQYSSSGYPVTNMDDMRFSPRTLVSLSIEDIMLMKFDVIHRYRPTTGNSSERFRHSIDPLVEQLERFRYESELTNYSDIGSRLNFLRSALDAYIRDFCSDVPTANAINVRSDANGSIAGSAQ